MPYTDNLYKILQDQATLDHTRAVTQDTSALAQQRMLGIQMNQEAEQRRRDLRDAIQSQFTNPASTPGGAGPAQGGMAYEYDSPLIQSLKSAEQGVEFNRKLLAAGIKVGDTDLVQKAGRDMDNQQKEYRLALLDVKKDDERRNKEASQAFQQADTPEKVQDAISYVAENLGRKQAEKVVQQLSRAFPGGLANATPEQIRSGLAPVLNQYTARGNILRSEASLAGVAVQAGKLEEAKAQNQIKNANVAQKQAGGSTNSGPLATEGMSAVLPPKTLRSMADQYLAGDKSVLSGLGYGNLGALNRGNLRSAITELAAERNMSGADIAAKLAELGGIMAGQRTAGTRAANIEMAVAEASEMGKLVTDASERVSRTEFMPINKAYIAFQKNTGDPEVRKFGAAINSFINAYARAVSPAGVPTVHDKEHAREMLSTADSHDQVLGIMDQLQAEMEAARKAPPTVRKQLRDAVTGADVGHATSLPPPGSGTKAATDDVMSKQTAPLTPTQIRQVATMKGIKSAATEAEYNALQPGDEYIGPSGIPRKKK